MAHATPAPQGLYPRKHPRTRGDVVTAREKEMRQVGVTDEPSGSIFGLRAEQAESSKEANKRVKGKSIGRLGHVNWAV